jgi:hypothetical protein
MDIFANSHYNFNGNEAERNELRKAEVVPAHSLENPLLGSHKPLFRLSDHIVKIKIHVAFRGKRS